MIKNIKSCESEQGPLHPVMGEDQELHVFHTTFVAVASDGVVYRHSMHYIPGTVIVDGFKCPNYNHQAEADAFCARVLAKGRIDTALWDVVEEAPSLEERFAHYAVEDFMERNTLY